jgi:hypothetical protein
MINELALVRPNKYTPGWESILRTAYQYRFSKIVKNKIVVARRK